MSAKKCDKIQNIAFLKTHKVGWIRNIIYLLLRFPLKCASSSLQNIFLRFGEKNHLNFAIPRGGAQLYGEREIYFFDCELSVNDGDDEQGTTGT